jgi:hypothetical protein
VFVTRPHLLTGDEYIDTVTIGSLVVSKQWIGVANKVSSHDHAITIDLLMTSQSYGFSGFDGILGYILNRPTDGMADILR